jgi:hypothetical protein
MLFARRGRIRLGMARCLKTQYLATGQVVVCKIPELTFLIPQTLLPTIPFYLLRVALAILLPVIRVCLAPLPRTFQTNLSIDRIGGDLLPMIITLSLVLACGLVADRLLRMISRELKNLLTVTTTEIFSSGGSEHPGGFLSGNTSRHDPPSAQIDGVFGPGKTTRLCGVALSTRLLDRLGWIGDPLSLGPSVYVRIHNAFGSLCTAQRKLPSFNRAFLRGSQTTRWLT